MNMWKKAARKEYLNSEWWKKRTYMDLLVDIPMPLGDFLCTWKNWRSISSSNPWSNPSSLNPAEWLRYKMHVDIHSTFSWMSLLNTLVLIWKNWSNSCPCIFYAKTGFSQGFVSPQFLLMLLFANRNSLGLAVFCRAGLPIDVLWSDASTVLPIASSWP